MCVAAIRSATTTFSHVLSRSATLLAPKKIYGLLIEIVQLDYLSTVNELALYGKAAPD
jgi:hypothetical protein